MGQSGPPSAAKAGLLATTHYLVALDLRKEIVTVYTIFGGKNPHPSWLGGSVPSPINARSTGRLARSVVGCPKGHEDISPRSRTWWAR